MSTQAIISVKQEDGTYKSITVENDGYVKNPGVGYVLSTYYYAPKDINKLIDSGNIEELLPYPSDEGTREQLAVMNTVKEIWDYCFDNDIEYLYIYEDGVWQWTSPDSYDIHLVELTTTDTMEKVENEKIDIARYCSYATAVKWNNTNLVLLNNVQDIDPDFDPYGDIDFPDEDDEDQSIPEFYQYYITDLSDDSVEWIRETFPGIHLSFSELLDSWILCVQHYGTSWSYVATQYIGHLNIEKEEYERFNKN
jgi:hypothetical protein